MHIPSNCTFSLTDYNNIQIIYSSWYELKSYESYFLMFLKANQISKKINYNKTHLLASLSLLPMKNVNNYNNFKGIFLKSYYLIYCIQILCCAVCTECHVYSGKWQRPTHLNDVLRKTASVNIFLLFIVKNFHIYAEMHTKVIYNQAFKKKEFLKDLIYNSSAVVRNT